MNGKLKPQKVSGRIKGFFAKGYLKSKDLAVALSMALTLMLVRMSAFASETETELELNFDPEKMFTWTQAILDIMMPILYITLGVSLAFIVVRALKQAFS